jgi:predicted transcriptional regulator
LQAASYSTVSLNEDLASALKKFRAAIREELIVVDSEDSQRVVGVLSRRDVMVAYYDRMYQRSRTGTAG